MEDDLIIKYLTNEVTGEERSEVETWLQEKALNQKRFDSFQKLWQLAGNYGLGLIPDKSRALEEVRIRLSGKNKPVLLKKYLWISVNKWKIAAAACIVASIVSWLLLKEKINPRVVMQEDFAGNTILTDSLPDGSVVTLNKYAKIRYTKGLEGNQRIVRLEGEAFFDVVHDASRPFIVLANDITITDVGTSFNVRDEQDTTEISVATGIVLARRGNDSVTLRAGERLIAVPSVKQLRQQIIRPVIINTQKNNNAQPSPKKQKGRSQQLPTFEESRDMMRKIIDDLVAEKIVADKDSLSWFGLDSSQFVVDGRSQPATLHEKFRRKYLKIARYGYFYGPVKVYGQGVFFEKKDLYK